MEQIGEKMLDLDNNQLYREVIMQHYKQPQNKGLVESLPAYSAKNPICGDSVELQIFFDNQGKIERVCQNSSGCSISVSSVSMLTTLLKGKSKQQAIEFIDNFLLMLQGEQYNQNTDFGDAVVFENIHSYPARYKCAATAWELAKKALQGE